jgi:hypothetical protein
LSSLLLFLTIQAGLKAKKIFKRETEEIKLSQAKEKQMAVVDLN